MNICQLLKTNFELYQNQIAFCDAQHQISYATLYHEVMNARNNILSLDIPEKCIVRLNVEKSITSFILFLALLADNYSVLPTSASESIAFPYDYVFDLRKKNGENESFLCNEMSIYVKKCNRDKIENALSKYGGMYINSTSGSSGSKKFCISNWDKIIVNTKAVCREYKMTSKDVWISLFPAHIHMHESFMRGFYSGGTSIFIDSMDVDSIAYFIAKKQVTQIQGTPNQLLLLTKKLSSDMAKSVRIVECVGGTLSSRGEEVLRRVFVNAQIIRAWGSSETTGVCISTIQTNDDTVNSIGKCISPYNCKLEKVQNVEHFKLMISGEAVMDFVWDSYGLKPISNWLDTGDLVEYGLNDNILFCGRHSGMIKYAGENIYPEEVEEMLCKIEGVFDATVVGKYDELYGEYPIALIQKNSNVDMSIVEIKKALVIQGIEINKIPKVIKITTKELPYKETGKKDRKLTLEYIENMSLN